MRESSREAFHLPRVISAKITPTTIYGIEAALPENLIITIYVNFD